MKKGLEIKYIKDLKSHKKYFYAFKEFYNEIFITFDEDIFYNKNTISSLINTNKKISWI